MRTADSTRAANGPTFASSRAFSVYAAAAPLRVSTTRVRYASSDAYGRVGFSLAR